MKLKLNKNEIETILQALIIRELNLRGILNEEEEKTEKDEALYRTFKKNLADTINLELKIQRRQYEEYQKSQKLQNVGENRIQVERTEQAMGNGNRKIPGKNNR